MMLWIIRFLVRWSIVMARFVIRVVPVTGGWRPRNSRRLLPVGSGVFAGFSTASTSPFKTAALSNNPGQTNQHTYTRRDLCL